MIKSFREEFTIDQRISESNRIKCKYPDRVPIILECSNELNSIITKKKYLVPRDISISSLPCILRSRSTKINSSKSIIIFINNKIPKSSSLVGELYDEYLELNKYKKEISDQFLYIYATYENTFG